MPFVSHARSAGLAAGLGAIRLRAMTHLPEITLDIYQQMPEEISKRIEVVDGCLVRCESPEPAHQVIARNFANSLWAAVKEADRARAARHRVANDVDVLIADAPRLHFRCPGVSVYRCVNEVVSADSVTTDTRDKRAEYAAAGIPHYWIVRMTANDGPAISVERFLLSADGVYVSLGMTVRGRNFNAVDATDPLRVVIAWEQLDDGL